MTYAMMLASLKRQQLPPIDDDDQQSYNADEEDVGNGGEERTGRHRSTVDTSIVSIPSPPRRDTESPSSPELRRRYF